jgi:hypothetical protein
VGIAPVSDFTKIIVSGALWLIAMAVQISGFTNPVVAALFALGGAAFLIWATVHHVRERRRAGKQILEPQHLILVGLCIGAGSLALIAGGYGWQLLTPPPVQAGAPTARAVPAPQTPDQIITVHAKQLSKGDKEDLTAILRTLSGIFDEAKSMIDDSRQISNNIFNDLNNNRMRVSLSQRIDEMKRIRDRGTALREKVSQVMTNGYFREYINYILISQQKHPFDSAVILSNSAEEYLSYLIEYQKTPEMNTMFLRPIYDKFGTATDNFAEWINNGRNHLDAVKDAL